MLISDWLTGAGGNNDVGLMMKLQAALKEVHREKEQLEKKLEEVENNNNSGGSSPQQSSDLLKLQDLEIENVKLREDMSKLRRSIADSGDNDNEAVREMADQYELLQEEHDRVKAECLQLRAVLANVQLSGKKYLDWLRQTIIITDWLTQYNTDILLVDQVHSSTSCVQQGRPRFSAAVYAEPPHNEKVILYSAYKVGDKGQCWGENRGGLLHEMFHLFGIMHTQMRRDRDEHITILRQNIQSQFSQEYDVSRY